MAIRTKGLTKHFKLSKVINDVDLHVPEGVIYGLLGPNGAGKKTFMRLILGLIKPSSGEIQIFKQSMPKERVSILEQVGAMIGKPAYYEHLTGYENLKVIGALHGITDPDQIKWALEHVGLEREERKKVKFYSLGMKQRLGIASAILHRPKLLLLDEPTNGLDPEGKLEILYLLKDMCQKEGVTIFLSSHLIHEIEQIASHIGIIWNGELLFQGRKENLLLGEQETLEAAYLNIIQSKKVPV